VEERRQQAMQDVIRSKTEWERTFDSVPDLVSIIDNNHHIVRMNRAMAERLGSVDDQIGHCCHLCVHGTENAPDYCPHALTVRTGREESAEFFSEKFHGYFKVTTSPFRDADGNLAGTVHIARDITRERQLEEQFRQAQKMEAVGRLAGGVAHDFNNLLQAIQGFTELVIGSLPDGDGRRSDLQEVMAAAGRARTLTQQLLAFSRRQILEPRVLDLNTVVHESGKLLARLIGEDVHLERNLSPDLWRVMADPSQVGQILMNLAVNARDAMPQGGVLTLGTRNVELGADEAQQMTDARAGRFVCLSVSDTGTGMTEEVRTHLFEPFFTTKTHGKGTGLGLAMVYGAVRQHDGWIYVYSHPGLGTTFRIYLPARLEADALPFVPPPKPAEPAPPGRGERILLVEDEPTVRALATRALEAAGYEVFAACGAEEARGLFDSGGGCFHLLFCDVVLPGESGLTLAEYMCDCAPSLSILLTSGYTDERSRWSAIRARGIRFLQKPYSMDNMLRLVRDILDHPGRAPDAPET
jgi:PAS domain S-box-containing protein